MDPIPTHLLKANLSSLDPVIDYIVTVSIATGVFPSAFEKALVTPMLKKTKLDANKVKTYRPVQIYVCVQNHKKVVAVRFSKHFSDNDLYKKRQSPYRPNHSTETALLRVRNYLLCILDERKAGIIVLLDVSAAFDKIDHVNPHQRLLRAADKIYIKCFYSGLKEVWGHKKKGPVHLKSTDGMETFTDSR